MKGNEEETQLKRSKPLTREKLFEYAKKLIWRGADVNLASEHMAEGKTLLSQAICENDFPVVQFLLEQGANPHICDLNYTDSCDYARAHGMDTLQFPQLANCDKNSRVNPFKQVIDKRVKEAYEEGKIMSLL